jgi:hypothetical protein
MGGVHGNGLDSPRHLAGDQDGPTLRESPPAYAGNERWLPLTCRGETRQRFCGLRPVFEHTHLVLYGVRMVHARSIRDFAHGFRGYVRLRYYARGSSEAQSGLATSA